MSIDSAYHQHHWGHLLKGGDILYPTPKHSSLGNGFFTNVDPETGRAQAPGKTVLSDVNTLVEDKQGTGMCSNQVGNTGLALKPNGTRLWAGG